MDIFLQPGEYYVGDADCRIRTLLGSCVSITLWHPGRRMGAMTHFLLASRGAGRSGELDAKYGEDAMKLILKEFARAKVTPRECEAKIFGGGNMFPKHTKSDSTLNIGQKNGEAARRLVSAQGISIISESLFGVGHRQIIFDVGNGHVWSRQIKPVHAAVTA
ncbi:MAG: chemotaxis protein CheD [Betaproteobacteria bacterium]